MADLVAEKTAIDEQTLPFKSQPVEGDSTMRCYLLELPPELRNEICKLALHQSKGAKVSLKTGCVDRKEIAITMANKQLHKECDTLYFEVNTCVFSFEYLDHPENDTTYGWLDELATFYYFVRRYKASLQEVRIQFEGLTDAEQIIWYHGRQFFMNVRGLRNGFEILRSNNIPALVSLCLSWGPTIHLDIPLADKTMAESAIRRQVETAIPDPDEIAAGDNIWSPGMNWREILVEGLFGTYR